MTAGIPLDRNSAGLFSTLTPDGSTPPLHALFQVFPHQPSSTPISLDLFPWNPDATQRNGLRIDNSSTPGQVTLTAVGGHDVSLNLVPSGAGTVNVAGAQLSGNFAALNVANTFTQPQTLPVIDKGGQVFNVKAYRALGNGVTDDTAAINAAITAAAAANGGLGGTVLLPPGTYMVSAPITLPSGVVLGGSGRTSTILRAMTTFSGSALVIMGTSLCFGTRVANMTVDCNGYAAKGITSSWLNEQSGLEHVTVQGFSTVGVDWSTGNCQNFTVISVEIYGTNASGIIGMRFGSGVGLARVRDCTAIPVGATGVAAPASSIGLQFIGGAGSAVQGIHVEGCITGIDIDGASGISVSNVSGIGGTGIVTNIVQLENIEQDCITLFSLFNGGATYTLNDLMDNGATAVTSDVGLYARGSGAKASQTVWNTLLYGSQHLGGGISIAGNLAHQSTGALGFYGASPAAKPTVTGSKAANPALTSLMTALATLGLVTDSTT